MLGRRLGDRPAGGEQHGEQHGRGREDADGTPPVEPADRDRAAPVPLLEHELRDQEATQHEEDDDAVAPAEEDRQSGVIEEDEADGHGAHAVEPRPVTERAGHR